MREYKYNFLHDKILDEKYQKKVSKQPNGSGTFLHA